MKIRETLVRFSVFATLLLFSGCVDESAGVGESTSASAASSNQASLQPTINVQDAGDRWISLGELSGTAANPVTVTVLSSARTIQAGSESQLQLQLIIESPWEIAACDASVPHQPTRIESVLPDGFQLPGEWQTPKSEISRRPDGGRVYSGQVLFQNVLMCRETVAAGEYELIWKITTQACDTKRCLRPTVSELKTVVKVVRNTDASHAP